MLKSTHFYDKVLDLLDFNKIPNSSTITTEYTYLSNMYINNSSYADYNM